MSYEAEQEQFAKELESVKSRFEALDNYFKQNPSEKEKRSGYSFGSDSVVERTVSKSPCQAQLLHRGLHPDRPRHRQVPF